MFSKMVTNIEKDVAMIQTRDYSAATQSDDLLYSCLTRQKEWRMEKTSTLLTH